MKRFTSLMLTLLFAVTTFAQDCFTNENLKNIVRGNYYIYYTDEHDVKHYLQTTGEHTYSTVTENPEAYMISTGEGSAFSKAYYIEMNGLCFSNPNPNNNHTLTTGTIAWNSHPYVSTVVFEDPETGLCALRSTNAPVDVWDENYFITHDTENNVVAQEGSEGQEALFVWSIEAAPVSLNTEKFYRLRAAKSSDALFLQIADYNMSLNRGRESEGALLFKSYSEDESQLFQFETSNAEENKYYIKNVNSDVTYYIYANQWNLFAQTENKTEFTINRFGDAYVIYQPEAQGGGFTGNSITTIADGTKIYNNQPEGAAHITWLLEEVVEMPFEYADSYENVNTWYYAVINSTNHNVSTGALGDGKYMRVGESDIPATTQTFGMSDVDNYSWGFVGNPVSGFKMVTKSGKAIKTSDVAEEKAELVDVNDGTSFTVKKPTNSVTGRSDAFCLLNSTNYLNLQGGYVKQWNETDKSSTILLTKRNETVVNVSNLGYATLYLGEPVFIPAEVEAYVVSSVVGEYAQMTQVTGILPANTGVILKNAGDHTFTTSPAATAIAENLLTGTLENAEITKEAGKSYYILANGEKGVGLYNPTIGGDETKFNNAANKAYLVVSGASEVASYSFRFGEDTTGVEKVEIRNEKSEIYDLTGRRVENPSNGIYIINGVKVWVK